MSDPESTAAARRALATALTADAAEIAALGSARSAYPDPLGQALTRAEQALAAAYAQSARRVAELATRVEP